MAQKRTTVYRVRVTSQLLPEMFTPRSFATQVRDGLPPDCELHDVSYDGQFAILDFVGPDVDHDLLGRGEFDVSEVNVVISAIDADVRSPSEAGT